MFRLALFPKHAATPPKLVLNANDNHTAFFHRNVLYSKIQSLVLVMLGIDMMSCSSL